MTDVLRRALFVLAAVLLYGAVGAWLSSIVPAGAQGEADDLQAKARVAIEGFFGAIMSGEPDKVAAVLAPEFQILRSDGSTYTAKAYAESSLPIIAEMPDIENLVVTATGDVVVTTYSINANETLDGKVVQSFAPRLSVFRQEGDRWLLVAHGNFAVIDQ